MRLAAIQVRYLQKSTAKSVFKFVILRLVSACIWFPQYMKNLELEADKANKHLEDKLLPKKAIYEDDRDSKAHSGDEDNDERVATSIASENKEPKTSEVEEEEPENETNDEKKKEK